MIEIKNLTYKAPNKEILKDININIEENLITVFLGENGSGKTTLFSRLLDINKKKYSGDIIIDNNNHQELKSNEIARLITFNFQIKHITDSYVYEMLELARSPYKKLSLKLSKEEENLIDYAIETTKINDLLNSKMNTLSGGERQMVYLAMSIIQNTKYIFLDEPDTYLDVENKRILFNILKDLRNKGKTIVLSLHSIDTAFSIADKIVVLKNGSIVGSINKNEFKEETLIEESFNIHKHIINDNGEEIFLFR